MICAYFPALSPLQNGWSTPYSAGAPCSECTDDRASECVDGLCAGCPSPQWFECQDSILCASSPTDPCLDADFAPKCPRRCDADCQSLNGSNDSICWEQPQSALPSPEPTTSPTADDPTVNPSEFPSNPPTVEPTHFPTESPISRAPSVSPTDSVESTHSPSSDPSKSPTINPSTFPVDSTSEFPTDSPWTMWPSLPPEFDRFECGLNFMNVSRYSHCNVLCGGGRATRIRSVYYLECGEDRVLYLGQQTVSRKCNVQPC